MFGERGRGRVQVAGLDITVDHGGLAIVQEVQRGHQPVFDLIQLVLIFFGLSFDLVCSFRFGLFGFGVSPSAKGWSWGRYG